MGILIRLIQVVWVAPNTLLGIAVGLVGLATGGGCQIRCGCLEFWGGFTTWFLYRISRGSGILAMTLGHSILGQSRAALDYAREHELVHVRQYQRWGPAFLPAYLGWSIWLWFRGKDPYRDNPFEVEAYAADERRSRLAAGSGGDLPADPGREFDAA